MLGDTVGPRGHDRPEPVHPAHVVHAVRGRSLLRGRVEHEHADLASCPRR